MDETRNIKLIAATLVVAVLLILTVFTSKQGGGQPPNAPAAVAVARPAPSLPVAQNSLDDEGVRLALSGIITDVREGAAAYERSGIRTRQALKLARIDAVASTTAFEHEYAANELAADQKYKGKQFALSGMVLSIEKDFAGTGVLTFASFIGPGVRAYLNDRGKAAAVSFSRGESITLVCRTSDRILGGAMAGDCEPLTDYLNSASDELTRSLRDFLQGRRALPHPLGNTVTELYVVGRDLPKSSRCRVSFDQSCNAEIMNLINDPVVSQRIDAEIKSMEIGLRFE